MQKEIRIHLDIWHHEIDRDQLIIWGCRVDGSRDITTKIIIPLKEKDWLLESLPNTFIDYLRSRYKDILRRIERIKQH